MAGPIEVMSDDPEIMALQAMIKGLVHFNKRSLTDVHIKVLMAVKLCIKVSKGAIAAPTVKQITMFYRGKEDWSQELKELVELRYLTEVINTYGEIVPTYRIGSMGATALRNMLSKKAA